MKKWVDPSTLSPKTSVTPLGGHMAKAGDTGGHCLSRPVCGGRRLLCVQLSLSSCPKDGAGAESAHGQPPGEGKAACRLLPSEGGGGGGDVRESDPGCPGPVIHEEEFKWGSEGQDCRPRVGPARGRALLGRLASVLVFFIDRGSVCTGAKGRGRYRVGVGSGVAECWELEQVSRARAPPSRGECRLWAWSRG